VPVADRLIREGFKTSARIGSVSERAELLFLRLLVTVCPLGRYHAEPELVKSGALPNRPRIRTTEVVLALQELERAGLLARYSVPDGAAYLEIPRFGQRLKYEARSPFPAPTRVLDSPGQDVMGFAAEAEPPPRPPPEREEKRREVSVSREPRNTRRRGRRDTRHACNCIQELQGRWPNYDIEDNLRRAQKQVTQKRGPGAVVTMWWFEEEWLAREPASAGPTAGRPAAAIEHPEPEGWRGWIEGSGLSWAGSAMAMGWKSLPAHWRAKILQRMQIAEVVR